MKSFFQRRDFGLAWLMVGLVGLMSWGSFLAIRTPYHHVDSSLSFDYLPDASLALMNQSRQSDLANGACRWSKSTVFDFSTGETWTANQEPLAFLMHLGDAGEAHWLAETGDVAQWNLSNPRDVRWIVTDLKSGRVFKSIPYNCETSGDRVVMRERFLVSKRTMAIEVIDLQSSTPTPASYPTMNTNRGIQTVGKSGAFVVFGPTRPPAQSLELFHIDNEGKVFSIKSWSAMPLAPATHVWPGSSEDEVATIDVSYDRINVRNTTDGSTVRTVQLPANFDAKKMKWRFSQHLFGYLDDRTLHLIDWRQGIVLPSIQNSDQHWRHRDSLMVVRSANGRRVFDLRTGNVLGSFQSQDGLTFFDAQRAIVSSSKNGWTITEFDLASGNVTRRWQPFGYVNASLILWLVSYLGWYVAWTRVSARKRWWTGLDVLLIGGVPFTLLTLRAAIGGDTLDSARHVYQYTQGIAMAAATVALTWLVFGRTRITLRMMPLLGVLALIATVLATVFLHQPSTAWQALASTFLPVVLLAVLLVMLRILQCRIVVGDEDRSRAATQTRYPLGDLFAITLLMSAGFAAVRPFAGTADVLLDVSTSLLALLIFQIVSVVVMFVALSRQRWVFRAGVAIVGFAVVYLAVEPMARYASDRLYDIYPLLPTNAAQRVLTMHAIATFALLLPYRTRGWRLRWGDTSIARPSLANSVGCIERSNDGLAMAVDQHHVIDGDS